LPTPEEAPKHSSLAGQLLVASPEMGDPRFYHAVILVVRHDQNGALGMLCKSSNTLWVCRSTMG